MKRLTALLLALATLSCETKPPPQPSEPKMTETKRVHLDIPLSTPFEVDIVSDHFAFERFKKKPGLQALVPVCKENLFTKVFGKTCEVYIGERAKHTGIKQDDPPLESFFVTFEVLDREITNEESAKEFLKKQKGWRESFEIKLMKNIKGLEIATAFYGYTGGRSYHYALVLGPKPIFITEANYVDLDSIKLKVLKK